MKKYKIGLCYVVDKKDCDPGFRALGFCYLKSSIEKHIPNKFDFKYFENKSNEDFDIVLVSSLSPNWNTALEVIKELRQKNQILK